MTMFTTLATYVHSIDPVALRFGPDDSAFPGIRWYGLSYLLGFIVAYPIIRRVLKRGVSTIRPEHALDLVLAAAFGAMIGGRLGYCIFYEPALLTRFSDSFPFWGVLMMNRGGMASHGGMLGIPIAMWIYARHWGHRWSHTVDVVAFAAPPGLFFGRIANFINGELYGRQASPDSPLAVKFPQEMTRWLHEEPERAERKLRPLLDRFAPEDVSLYEGVQVLIHRIQAGHQEVIEAVGPILTPRYPSQLFAALTEGLVVMLVLLVLWYRPRKPLTLTGTFAISYAVMRIFNELFREPDVGIAQFEAIGITLSRGQLLSVLLLLLGVSMVWWAKRQHVPPMGGWGRHGEVEDEAATGGSTTATESAPGTPAARERRPGASSRRRDRSRKRGKK